MTNCLSEINQIRLIFHPYEVVGRGSDTQLHMGEKFNSITLMTRTVIKIYFLELV